MIGRSDDVYAAVALAGGIGLILGFVVFPDGAEARMPAALGVLLTVPSIIGHVLPDATTRTRDETPEGQVVAVVGAGAIGGLIARGAARGRPARDVVCPPAARSPRRRARRPATGRRGRPRVRERRERVRGEVAEELAPERMEVFADPGIRELALALLREAVPVGLAEGARLADDEPERTLAAYDRLPADGGSSMLYDRLAGRPLEHDALTGAVVRAARRHGIPVPLNEAVLALLGGLDGAHGAQIGELA